MATLEEELEKIENWANRGTLAQFETEAEARLSDSEYAVERIDDTLRFLRVHKEGGFLGIGGETLEEPVLEITESEGIFVISSEPRNGEFIEFFASQLRQH